MKRAALLAVATAVLAMHMRGQNVTLGNGVTMGTGVTAGLTSTAPPPPPSSIFFTPVSGPYTGTQNVSITQTYGAGNSIFYTASGIPATEASTRYAGAIPLSSSTTLNALVESTGSVRQETQNLPDIGNDTSKGWKFCTPLFNSTNGTPTSGSSSICGGGVGSDQPSTWSITPGSGSTPQVMSITSTGGFPQFLYTLGGSGCDSCTKITQDKCVMPVNGANMQNYEMDVWSYDGTRKRLHMIGLQCNQQNGTKQWQIDNEQGSWQNTGVTDGCPLTTTPPATNGCPAGYTHVVIEAHWAIGDTGCGGLGCDHYDVLTINGNVHVLNRTLESDNPNWGSACAQQDQLDLNGGGTPANPKTAGEKIIHNNVTCSFATQGTSSATYTF